MKKLILILLILSCLTGNSFEAFPLKASAYYCDNGINFLQFPYTKNTINRSVWYATGSRSDGTLTHNHRFGAKDISWYKKEDGKWSAEYYYRSTNGERHVIKILCEKIGSECNFDFLNTSTWEPIYKKTTCQLKPNNGPRGKNIKAIFTGKFDMAINGVLIDFNGLSAMIFDDYVIRDTSTLYERYTFGLSMAEIYGDYISTSLDLIKNYNFHGTKGKFGGTKKMARLKAVGNKATNLFKGDYFIEFKNDSPVGKFKIYYDQ